MNQKFDFDIRQNCCYILRNVQILMKTALRVGFWTNFAKYVLCTPIATLENISHTNNISIESSIVLLLRQYFQKIVIAFN